jgi:hypothetical protein
VVAGLAVDLPLPMLLQVLPILAAVVAVRQERGHLLLAAMVVLELLLLHIKMQHKLALVEQ